MKVWKIHDLLFYRVNKEQLILTENSENIVLLNKALSNWNTANLKKIYAKLFSGTSYAS